MLAVSTVMLVLLAVGAALGGDAQRLWWLAAVASDQIGVYVVGSDASAADERVTFAERFGLIVIIAVGESVVAVGAATSNPHLSGRDAFALLCGLAIAVCVWWLYFDETAAVGEAVLRAAPGGFSAFGWPATGYTYIHFVLVAGIVFMALGLVVLIGDHGHADAGRNALYGGVACYLAGHCLFCWRNVGGLENRSPRRRPAVTAGDPRSAG